MFTGIVEELGQVRQIESNASGARLQISASLVLEDTRVGDSIAVDGCCLTVVDRGDDWWAADAVEETLRRTGLGSVRRGDLVNLERPMRLSDRLGGHLVQGHVDGQGQISASTSNADGSLTMHIEAPSMLMRYIAEKGSIAVDGVSLTVVDVAPDAFSVALIPHTLRATTLGRKRVGDRVNLETDVVAKYLSRLMEGRPAALVGEAVGCSRSTGSRPRCPRSRAARW
jgi:riboflavin synthase